MPLNYPDIVNGTERGLVASLARGALAAIEVPYGWAVAHRNRQFDCGRRATTHVGVPVISVGNITLGGTGKTPMVAWVVKQLAACGCKAGIVSRGYRAAAGSLNDEGLELAIKLPETPHIQNPDRVAAARACIARYGCTAIVMDDGFQHRRLARDLDIVLLDATNPFGHERLFPRGLLREPLASLRRANAMVLTRADAVTSERRAEIHDHVNAVQPSAVWLEAAHAPRTLIHYEGTRAPLTTLGGRRVAAFCGLGNPLGFRHTLERCGYDVVAFRALPDHCAYPPQSLESIERWVAASAAEAAVCSLKDLVKLRRGDLAGRPLWAVEIGMEFLESSEPLTALLASVVARQ